MVPVKKNKPSKSKPDEKVKGLDIIGPEGPIRKVLAIDVPASFFNMTEQCGFTKFRISSKDRTFAFDLILKKAGSGAPVPNLMPSLEFIMDLDTFNNNFESDMLIRLSDDASRSAVFEIAAIKPVAFMTASEGAAKKEYAN